MKSSTPSKTRAPGLRGAGLGIELAASLIGFTLFGVWIDQKFDTGPWGVLVSVTFGFIGGFYNFIRSSLRAMSAPSFPKEGKETDESDH